MYQPYVPQGDSVVHGGGGEHVVRIEQQRNMDGRTGQGDAVYTPLMRRRNFPRHHSHSRVQNQQLPRTKLLYVQYHARQKTITSKPMKAYHTIHRSYLSEVAARMMGLCTAFTQLTALTEWPVHSCTSLYLPADDWLADGRLFKSLNC